MTTTTSMLDLALSYQELGWQVFPLRKWGKIPWAGSHGFKDASDLEEHARSWWAESPESNIGIRTGEESGFWVLDVDAGDGGYETLAQLEHLHGPIDAPFATTANGGRHYFFRWPSGLDVPSRAKILPGIDSRGRGGYIVAPGSMLGPEKRYEISPDFDLSKLPEAPAWLLEIVCGQTRATRLKNEPPAAGLPDRQILEIRSALSVVPSDDRDTWLHVGMALHSTRAGSTARALWDEWSQKSAKFDAADQDRTWTAFSIGRKNDIGLPTLFKFAYDAGWVAPSEEPKAAPQAPQAAPEWIWKAAEPLAFDLAGSFPDSLDWFKDFIRAVSRVFQTPPEFSALLALGMASGACAGRYEITLSGAQWKEPANLWILCAMPSGALKSQVYRVLSAPFYEHDLKLNQTAEEADWQGRLMVANAVLRNVEDRIKKQAGVGDMSSNLDDLNRFAAQAQLALRIVQDSRPPNRGIVGSSFTTPALVKHLQEHDGRCLILDPEGSVFGYALNGQTDLAKDLDPWLKSYSGEPIKEVRIGNGKDIATRHVANPCLAIAACTQPENLSMFRDRYAEGRGFLARFVVAVFPYRLPAVAIVKETIPDELAQRWASAIRALLTPPRPSEALVVTLSGEGATYFEEWASTWLKDAREDLERDAASATGYGSAFGAKLRGMALRMILVLHCMESMSPEQEEPRIETVRAVLDYLVPFVRAHVERLSSVIRDDPNIRIAERLLRWLDSENRSAFSRTQAFNSLKAGLSKVDDLNGALSVLVDTGWIKPVGAVTVRGQGTVPAARRYEAHPELARYLRELGSTAASPVPF